MSRVVVFVFLEFFYPHRLLLTWYFMYVLGSSSPSSVLSHHCVLRPLHPSGVLVRHDCKYGSKFTVTVFELSTSRPIPFRTPFAVRFFVPWSFFGLFHNGVSTFLVHFVFLFVNFPFLSFTVNDVSLIPPIKDSSEH